MEEGGVGTGGGLRDRLLGWVGLAMIAAAVYLLFFGGPGDAETASAGPPPTFEVLESSAAASPTEPLQIRFRVDAPLRQQPGGWGSDGYHLHASLDGQEIMPGPADIQRVDGSTYRWTLPRIPPESRSITLFWSDAQHRPVTGTETRPLRLRVE